MEEKHRELNNQILALLFSVALTCWTMDTFFEIPFILNFIAVLALNSLIFASFNYLKKKKIVGMVLFFIGSGLYFVAAILILSVFSSIYGTYYILWLALSHPDSSNPMLGFWLGTIMLASYGFTSTVYYFTVIRFRIVVLFLISIIPFMLQSAKSQKEISIAFIIFIVLFFSMCIETTRRKGGNGIRFDFANIRWYLIAMLFFITITLSLAYVTPKPNSIPKVAYLDAVINQTIQPLGAAVQNAIQKQNSPLMIFDPVNMKRESFVDSITAPLGDKVLFEVKADEPLYLRFKCWDRYENNKWIMENSTLEKVYPLEDFAKSQMSLGVIVSLIDRMKNVYTVPTEFSGLRSVVQYQSFPRENMKATVYNKFNTTYYLTPTGITSLEDYQKGKKIYMNNYVNCFSDQSRFINGRYTIEYISQQLYPASRELQLVRQLDKSLAEYILNADNYAKGNSDSNITVSSDERSILLASRDEMDTAYEYFTNLPGNLPQRIYDLANEITKGKTSDYDKAYAIEQYFHLNGFKYSLSPSASPRGMDYNDYFIFESKKGVCVHFASAMVILARACGLPARYVEGFVAREKDPKTGLYLVREKNAHAFPEVYIAGYGWMAFEPTVSVSESENGFFLFLKNTADNIAKIISLVSGFIGTLPIWVKTFFVPVIALVILLIIESFIRGREKLWRKRIQKIDRSKSLEEIFKKIDHLFKKIDLDKKKYETPTVYSLRIFDQSGITLSKLSDSYNKSKYGGIEPSSDDIKTAVEVYDEAVILVRKRLGKLKSWAI